MCTNYSLRLQVQTGQSFSTKTSVSTYESTQHHNPEEKHLLLCADQQEIVWMTLLHETSFMQLLCV
jgi:hypothetical protein